MDVDEHVSTGLDGPKLNPTFRLGPEITAEALTEEDGMNGPGVRGLVSFAAPGCCGFASISSSLCSVLSSGLQEHLLVPAII